MTREGLSRLKNWVDGVSPSWQCRGRTSESVHGDGSRDEHSRKELTTTGRDKGPTLALCSGNIGLGQG